MYRGMLYIFFSNQLWNIITTCTYDTIVSRRHGYKSHPNRNNKFLDQFLASWSCLPTQHPKKVVQWKNDQYEKYHESPWTVRFVSHNIQVLSSTIERLLTTAFSKPPFRVVLKKRLSSRRLVVCDLQPVNSSQRFPSLARKEVSHKSRIFVRSFYHRTKAANSILSQG